MPPVVVALVLGLVASLAVWFLVEVIEILDATFPAGPFARLSQVLAGFMILGLAGSAAAVLVIQRGRDDLPRRIGSDLPVVLGCGIGGGLIAGLISYGLEHDYWLIDLLEPGSSLSAQMISRLMAVLAFGVLGASIGAGCALTKRTSPIAIGLSAIGGVLSGLLTVQLVINLSEVRWLGWTLIELLYSTVACLPLVLAVGVTVQIAQPKQAIRATQPVGGPLATPPAPDAGPVLGLPPGARMSAPNNGLAIASMVLGIVGACGLGSLLAVIFGHVALGQIDRSRGMQRGRGMAIAGLVLGYVGLVGIVLWVLVIAASSGSDY